VRSTSQRPGWKPIKVDGDRRTALASYVRAELERIFSLSEKFTPET
jgi:hypothetical protein